jgi:hypothetical protein
MNYVLGSVLFLALLAVSEGQNAPAKPDRSTMVFQPGAKDPSAGGAAAKASPTPAGAKPASPTPAASPSASPAASPKGAQPAAPAVVTSTVPPEPAQIVKTFFGLIQEGDIDAAYWGLTKGSKIAERPEELRALKTKTKEAVEVFGVVHGYDLVDSKPVGERLVRATYLSLGHEYPLRWRFYFYRSETVWKLIDLRVDDRLAGIFDEPEEAKAVAPTP